MKNIAIGFITTTIGGLTMAAVISYSMNQQARIDCAELQKQAATFQPWDSHTQAGFYVTQQEVEECASVHMTVNAPVL